MLQHSVNALEACVVPGPRPPSCSILLSQQGILLRGRREGGAGGGRRDIRGPSLGSWLRPRPRFAYQRSRQSDKVRFLPAALSLPCRPQGDVRPPWPLPAGGGKSPSGGQWGRKWEIFLLCPHPQKVGFLPWFQLPQPRTPGSGFWTFVSCWASAVVEGNVP